MGFALMAVTLWYYEHEGRPGGPVTVQQLKLLAASGQIAPSDKVRKDDMTHWVRAKAVKGLFSSSKVEGGDALSGPSAIPGEIETGASFFDAPIPGPDDRHDEEEDNTAFDFFSPQPPPKPAPSKPAVAKPAPVAAVPEAKVSAAIPVAPTPEAVPIVAEVVESGELAASVDGPAIGQPFSRTTLRLMPRWLQATTLSPDGQSSLTYLRLAQIESIYLGPKAAGPGQPSILSFGAASRKIELEIEGNPARYQAFVDAVVATV